MSLRATGEGHISSITFRTGTIDGQGKVSVDTPSRYVTTPDHIPPISYHKEIFWHQLQELGIADNISETILKTLQDHFTVEELSQEIQYLRRYAHHRNTEFDRTSSRLLNLAKSNYEVVYSPGQSLTERVIFPNAPNESNGIEDARFVRFVDDDGTGNLRGHLHGLRRARDHSAASGNQRFPALPHLYAERTRGAEQGDGPVSPADSRSICNAFTPGRRESLSHAFR